MKYHGTCHCEKVKIECEFELSQPTMCNCSYCSKRNAMLHIVDDLKVLTGSDSLSCYRFNRMDGKHYFCSSCGIFVYSIPPDPIYPYAVNLCILEHCDWRSKEISYFDGQSL